VSELWAEDDAAAENEWEEESLEIDLEEDDPLEVDELGELDDEDSSDDESDDEL
jgi:hypothetical protein